MNRAPAVLMTPRGTAHKEVLVDDRSVAGGGTHRTHDHEEQGREVQRPCFFCLEGWVFIGSLDHDGEEVVESHRCRRCNGSGVMPSSS